MNDVRATGEEVVTRGMLNEPAGGAER